MSETGLFVVGALVTAIVAAALGLLFYAAVLDGRDEALARDGLGSRSGAARSAKNLLELALASEELHTLATAIDHAGLTDVLTDERPHTLFAPSDEAFASLPEGTVESLLASPDTLADVIGYHLVPGRLSVLDVGRRRSAATVQGEQLAISTNGAVRVDGAAVVREDIEASNGVIHIIDRVLLPARI